MTPEEEVLGRVVALLERLSIPYMVTGSIATSFHGRPRATHDADVVIDPTPEQLDVLVVELDAARFYVDADGARVALRECLQFNVIEMLRAVKVDLIIRKRRPFSEEEFKRRQRVDLSFGRPVDMVTPEDAIVSKLEWARRSGDSERQLRDAAGVLELNPAVDKHYIARWAEDLGVTDLWRRIAAGTP
jgi:hypothetical protein